MKINHIALLFFTGLLVASCNRQTPAASCSSSDTQKTIDSLLIEQAVQLTAEKRYDQYDGSFVFGATKIRASLTQIQLVIENIKMVKQDPNNGKIFCSGLLKVTVPTTMLTDVEQVRDSQHQLKLTQYARQLSIESSNNMFSQNVEYSVKPAGEGKKPQVEFESAAWVHLLDEITTAALLKPTLEIQETTYVQKNEQAKQAAEPLKPEATQVKSEAEKLKAIQEKQGLEKLNKELLEAELVEKELSHASNASKNKDTQQLVTQSVSTDTKQTSPGFNCAKASKPTEITICASSELAALDVENMQFYKKAKAADPEATHSIWKDSIKSKYACGTDVDCIKTVYKKSVRDYGCVAAEDKSNCGFLQ